MTDDTESNRPLEHIRVGFIQAAIWKSENERGVHYRVTVQKHYKSDGNWHTATSYGRDDLLALAKAVDMAHTRLMELYEIDRDQARAASTGNGPSRTR